MAGLSHGFLYAPRSVAEDSLIIPTSWSTKSLLSRTPANDALDSYDDCRYGDPHKRKFDQAIAPSNSLDIREKQELIAFLASLDAAKAQPRKALRIIFSFVDQALLDGKYALCDSLLDQLKPSELDVSCMVGFLAITLSARNQLQRRTEYARRLEEWLRKERPKDVEGLLVGLR
jgi:hypothetical protein